MEIEGTSKAEVEIFGRQSEVGIITTIYSTGPQNLPKFRHP